MKIQVLNHQGKSIKAIAREIGVSRNTVRKYLRKSNKLPTYKKREPRPTKLSAYESYLKNRVEQAKPEWIPAIVLYREIQEQGYNGKLTQLRRFLAPLKLMRPEEPLVRFETPASANGAVGVWLDNIANERIHATTLVKPNARLIEEKQHLLPLPPSKNTTEATLPTNNNRPMPVESIQYPLGIYDQFMAGSFV